MVYHTWHLSARFDSDARTIFAVLSIGDAGTGTVAHCARNLLTLAAGNIHSTNSALQHFFCFFYTLSIAEEKSVFKKTFAG